VFRQNRIRKLCGKTVSEILFTRYAERIQNKRCLALNMAKVYLLLLVLCGFAQADQVNCIKWKDANGTVIGDGANCSGNNFALGVDASGVGQCAQPAFSNLSGTATDAQIPDNITVSLAATATALAANGANCAGNNFALGVDASGVGECAQPAFSNLSGTATDAQVPDNITISLAATATALAADPANCSAGSVAAGITAGGVAEGCAVFAVTKGERSQPVPELVHVGNRSVYFSTAGVHGHFGRGDRCASAGQHHRDACSYGYGTGSEPGGLHLGAVRECHQRFGTLACTTVWTVSGTSTFTTTAVASGACQTTVTTAATGTATTDTIDWAYSTAPVAATDGRLTIQPYVTANNVNFMRCNNTAASVTPTALTVNWRVIH
jgi:hypothetical protein